MPSLNYGVTAELADVTQHVTRRVGEGPTLFFEESGRNQMTNSEIIKTFNNLHGYANADTAFVRRLRLQDMTEKQIASVVVIVSTICLKCFDNPAPCNCANDE